MARPLSEEKRDAILAASVTLVAAMGTGAPTAKIARSAGIAEGTLFVYFANKDELLNQLYLVLKADLGETMMRFYPADSSVRDRVRHVWGAFIDWGATHPAKRQAMRRLSVSERITEESRQQGAAPFGEVNAMLERSLAEGELRHEAPAFVGAILESLSETTLEFIAREPAKRETFKQAGFAILWNGIAS